MDKPVTRRQVMFGTYVVATALNILGAIAQGSRGDYCWMTLSILFCAVCVSGLAVLVRTNER